MVKGILIGKDRQNLVLVATSVVDGKIYSFSGILTTP